jgi:hypothetical protein
MKNIFKNKGVKNVKKPFVVELKGCQFFNPYGGCQYGHYQEQSC